MSDETTYLIINSFIESAVLCKKKKTFRGKEYKFNLFKLSILWKNRRFCDKNTHTWLYVFRTFVRLSKLCCNPHIRSVLFWNNCAETPYKSDVCDGCLCWISARWYRFCQQNYIGLSMLDLPHVIKLLSRNSETRFILEYHASFFHQQKDNVLNFCFVLKFSFSVNC